jgi:hypothetical protein
MAQLQSGSKQTEIEYSEYSGSTGIGVGVSKHHKENIDGETCQKSGIGRN